MKLQTYFAYKHYVPNLYSSTGVNISFFLGGGEKRSDEAEAVDHNMYL